MIKTLCKNCSFEHEPLQCFVGRLDKLKEAPNTRVEEENGHYVIYDKSCDWSTPRYWGHLEKADLKDLAWKVRENRILKIPFIIVTNKGTTLQEISRTVRSLQNQQVEPYSIHIINYTKIDSKKILALRGDSSIPITVEQIILDDYPERFIWNKVQKINQTFYGIICAGFEVPVEFIRKIDQSFNDDMNHFVFLSYDGFVEIHSTLLSEEVGGDFIETTDGYKYRDKVYQWCKRNFLEGLMQRWEDI